MIKRFAYIVLQFSAVLVLSACGRDRRHHARHHLLTETEVTSFSSKGHGEDASSATEKCSEEEFKLQQMPAMPDYVLSQILERLGYITSYNHDTKCPNWVSWHLTSGHTDGPYPRNGVPYYSNDGIVKGIGNVTQETCRNGYFVDLDANEPRQQLSDWTRDYNMSHGHMCPAGDNKWDKASMNQSFLLTNMCPQDEKLNWWWMVKA